MHQGPSKGLQDNILSLGLAISPDTQSPHATHIDWGNSKWRLRKVKEGVSGARGE